MTKRTRRHMRYAFLAGGMTILAAFFYILPVFRGRLQTYLGIGDNHFGLLFSLIPIVGIGGGMFGGALIDRIGMRQAIRICLLGIACAQLLVAVAGPRYTLFVAAAIMIGLFYGPLFIAVNLYLARLFPRHRRRVLSLNMASTSMGGIFYPLLAEGLLRLARHETIGFAPVLHVPFLLVGMLVLAGSFQYRRRADSPGGRRAAARAPWTWRELALPPQAWLLAALIGLHGAADTTLHIWMARFLESESFTHTPLAPGVVLSGFACAYLLARVMLAILPEHHGRHALLFLPGLCGGTLMVLAILSRNYYMTAIGYVLGAFLWSTEYPAFVSAAMLHAGRRFGSVMAASVASGGIALFVLLNGVGLLVERFGEAVMWRIMLIPACGFILAGIGGAFWVHRDRSASHKEGKDNGSPFQT